MTQTTIDAEALRGLLDRCGPVTVLDIRPTEACAERVIPGSIHVSAFDAPRAGDPESLTGANRCAIS